MGFLPNVFSDEKLRARQDQLDGQWKSLKALYNGCDYTPSETFAQFATDFRNWSDFYASESDWSSDSKTATDEWQKKAQDWASRLSSWGCNGSLGAGGEQDATGAIPTVPDPPPDDPSLFDRTLEKIDKARDSVLAPIYSVGWVAVGVAAAIIIALTIILTKGRAKGYGIEVGGK